MVTEAGAGKATLASFWRDLPREGRLLLSVVVFEFVGTGLVLPFWVVYLHEVRDFSLSTTGLLIGLEPLVGLLALGPGGSAIDKYGARVVLIVSLACAIGGQLTMSVASTVPVAALALALQGVAFGVSFPASQSLVAVVVPSAIRQRYFGVNFTLLNLGIGIGGILGGALVDVDRTWTFQLIYLVDAISFLPGLFLLLVPLRHVSGRAEPPDDTTGSKPSYREVLRLPGVPLLLVLGFLASFVGYAQLNSGLPAFARATSGVSTQGLGIAFAANTAVIVVVQLVVLQRIEGRRRTRVIVVMASLWATAWLVMGLSGLTAGLTGTLLVVVTMSVFALGETMLQPTLPAITNDLTTDRLRGRTNAIASAAFQVPMMIGPPISGWLIQHDLETVYVATLVVGCVLLAGFAVLALEPRLTPAANGLGIGQPAELPATEAIAADPLRASPSPEPPG